MKQGMIGVVLLAATMSGTAGAQSSGAGGSAKDEVLAAQKRFYEAYRTCNAKDMEQLVVDDMLYFHSTGSLQHNKAELLKSLAQPCGFDVLRVDVQTVRIYGDTAVLFGDLKVKRPGVPAVNAPLIATQVFVRQNGRWLFASNQSSEVIPLGSSQALASPRQSQNQSK